MAIDLWDHQTQAVNLLRSSLSAGKKRPMLKVPTGGGKTRIAAAIIERMRERRKRALFIVDAISLVGQTYDEFGKLGLDSIGIIQADDWRTDWSKPIQVASVATLQRRGVMPDADVAFVDEAHVRNAWLEKQWAGEWGDKPVIGLSATPWAKGLGNVYDDLITPVTMHELTAIGKLLPFRVFAPSHPDLTGVGSTGGDFNGKQLGERMDNAGLIADIVSTWLRLGEDRPTLCYCVDRAHAKKVQERFLSAGVPAEYIDMNVDGEERTRIQGRLERGETKVVCNIATLTKGIDWKIGCIIIARPTKSKMLHVQIAGRVIRANSGFDDGLVLDHSDNMLRLGLPPDISDTPLCTLKKGEKKKERPDPLPKECGACGFLKPPKVRICPVCQHEPVVTSDLEEDDGELVQIAGEKKKDSVETKVRWLKGLLWLEKDRGYKDGWARNQYRSRFDVWPDNRLWAYHSSAPLTPDIDILSWVKSRQIAYAKRNAA